MHKKCGRFLKPAERAACFVCARLEGKDKFVGGYLGDKIVISAPFRKKLGGGVSFASANVNLHLTMVPPVPVQP